MIRFKENLQEMLESKELSLRKVSKECGVTAAQLGRYLRGTSPTIYNACKLAKYFDCSLDYLFGLTDKNYKKNFKEIDMSLFIPRYEALLRQNNISNYKFAMNNHFSESSYRKWRKGEAPNMETLILIAEELSSSIDYLVGRI